MRTKRVTGIVLAGALLLPVGVLAQGQGAYTQATTAKKSLYERVGGYDMIAKIVDAFLPHLRDADPKIPQMVSGLADTSRARNRQMIVDQICNLAGGPCLYIGRTMEAAHQGLQITDEMWNAQMKAWALALDDVKIKDPEKADFLALIEKLKDGIVQKKKI